jgi:hypothetical protein
VEYTEMDNCPKCGKKFPGVEEREEAYEQLREMMLRRSVVE